MLACVLLTDQDVHDNHYVEAFVDTEGGKVKKILKLSDFPIV